MNVITTGNKRREKNKKFKELVYMQCGFVGKV